MEKIGRQIILALLGLVLIVLSVFGAKKIIDSKKSQPVVVNKVVKTAYVDTVVNGLIPITISSNGKLEAVRKIEIYSEVQGILKSSNKAFKPGVSYSSGETMLNIDGSEFNASIVAQRSSLFNQIASAMPDLKFDQPEAFYKWQAYLNSFNVDISTPPLPIFSSNEESYYINAKNIVTTYYNIKNQEERYKKYRITAPFSGVLTETMVSQGTLVRAGQKMGTLIDQSRFEMEVSIPESYKNYLKVGNKVVLQNLDKTKSYAGRVVRKNSSLDANSQSALAYIEVTGKDLSEGMYLEVELAGEKISNAFQIDRKLLVNNNKLFAVNDTVLTYLEVDPVYFTDKTAIIKGLKDGTLILNRNIPGAYPGMLVEIAK